MGIFVRATPNGFRLIMETWKDGKKSATTVPKESYRELGFRSDMTVNEAKDRASQINTQKNLEARKIANTKRRQELEVLTKSAYLPELIEAAFREHLDEVYADNPERLTTVLKHWSTAKKLIASVALDPKDFYAERVKILNYYKREHWSPDYIKRITSILNQWGYFCSRRTNSFFQEIPGLSMDQAQRIVDAREASGESFRTKSSPLLWIDLKNKKSVFEHANLLEQWNWLFIGLWFGLRPTEIDNLRNKKLWKVKKDSEHGIEVLEVYQTKLTKVPKDERWKQIPLYLPEQKTALRLIESSQFKRPLVKSIRRLLGPGFDTYSPRHGFTDLMLGYGFELDDVSLFMGHHSIDTTWRHYKNKRKFKLPKTG